MFSRTFHYSLLGFFLALFLSGHTLMLYPLTIGALSVLFHKHRVGNILGIRNLNLQLFFLPPDTPQTAHLHWASLAAKALSFLSHASLKQITTRPFYVVRHV